MKLTTIERFSQDIVDVSQNGDSLNLLVRWWDEAKAEVKADLALRSKPKPTSPHMETKFAPVQVRYGYD